MKTLLAAAMLLLSFAANAALIRVTADTGWFAISFEGLGGVERGPVTLVYDTADGSVDSFTLTLDQQNRPDLQFVGTGQITFGSLNGTAWFSILVDAMDLSGAIAPGQFTLGGYRLSYPFSGPQGVDYWSSGVVAEVGAYLPNGTLPYGALEHDWAVNFAAVEVPEPPSLALVLACALGLAVARRRN